MHYISPAKPMHFPVLVDRPATRPVVPIAEDSGALRDARRQQAETYVHRGELLDEVFGDRRYRPTQVLDLDAHHRRAIEAYHRVAYDPTRRGQILDGFI